MRRDLLVALFLALAVAGMALVGCGSSLNGQDGHDAGTDVWHSEPACAALDACSCLAASDRCTPRAEACWCPTECGPIECFCGGGKFLACEDKAVVAACTQELTAAQVKCADQGFVQYIAGLCSSASDPGCIAACLANLNSSGSCSEIDCSFCPVCDCAPAATGSTFASCVAACNTPSPPLR
jgi:hypothetical protein